MEAVTLRYIAVPHDVRRKIDAALRRSVNLLPSWVYLIEVLYETEQERDGDLYGVMNIETRPEYRMATITLTPVVRELSKSTLRDCVVHEYAHCYTAHLHHLFNDLLDGVKLSKEAKSVWRTQWRLADEGATCDIAHRLQKRGMP